MALFPLIRHTISEKASDRARSLKGKQTGKAGLKKITKTRRKNALYHNIICMTEINVYVNV
jgi:hypothetical protein